jgi:hypothetical protein
MSRFQGWWIRHTGEGDRVDLLRHEKPVLNDMNDADSARAYIRRSRYAGEPIVQYDADGYIEQSSRK